MFLRRTALATDGNQVPQVRLHTWAAFLGVFSGFQFYSVLHNSKNSQFKFSSFGIEFVVFECFQGGSPKFAVPFLSRCVGDLVSRKG
jgi:hypothetical protein